MRLLIDDPNPYNVLEIRKLRFIPKHFTVIKLQHHVPYWTNSLLTTIDNWIYNNCSGRYSIAEDLDVVDNKVEKIIKIGFENASESSYFSLGCSELTGHEVKVL